VKKPLALWGILDPFAFETGLVCAYDDTTLLSEKKCCSETFLHDRAVEVEGTVAEEALGLVVAAEHCVW
jgi:hypothetical protein